MSVELVKILVVSFEKYFDHGMVLEPHYKKSVPPMTMNQDYTLEPVRVSVGFLLEDIPSINEAKNVIEVKLSTTISWNESRAIYHNLKDDQSKNALRDYEKRKLWVPKLIFQNSKRKLDTRKSRFHSEFSVSRKGALRRGKSDIAEDIEMFLGKENPVVMVLSTTINVKCSFDFQLFPFDTQVIKRDICLLIYFRHAMFLWWLTARRRKR